MKQVLIALALLFVLPAAGADEREELRTLLDEFLAGASVNDAAMHDRFWAEDLVYTSSNGTRFGKAEIMSGLSESEEPDSETPAYSAQDVNINLFGETAVITFRLVAKKEDQVQSEYFNTGVFRNRDGTWRAVTWQATRIPDRP